MPLPFAHLTIRNDYIFRYLVKNPWKYLGFAALLAANWEMLAARFANDDRAQGFLSKRQENFPKRRKSPDGI